MNLIQTKLFSERTKAFVVISVLCILVFLCAIINIGIGAVPISPIAILKTFFGLGDENTTYIVMNYRMPRILLAIFIGACLAISGVITQSVLHNPLAAPDTLGISGGAGIAAVFVTIIWQDSPPGAVGIAAFIGGAASALIVYFIAYRNGIDRIRLALVGVAVTSFCQAFIELIMIKANTNVNAAILWLNGSLWGRTWEQVIQILPWVVLFFPFVWLMSKALDILQLGDSVATGLGLKVELVRFFLLASAVLLAGASVAAAGMIGFVGLISPHIARSLVGAEHQLFIPVSALIGALLLLVADSIGRGLIPPTEIPTGLVITAVGAPYFLYLMWKESKNKKHGF
ncbi:iron ABC transporter permease [Bacillus sp. 03113]|uniref:FecCD family ABC transporter permease n=1 Tax=Bacillus sp. 03113 TaxID=2578211 RepID=UPI001142523A|nr:iron ABC transporter permease [Bacillus sp. 03113]